MPKKISYMPDPNDDDMFEMVINGEVYAEILKDDKQSAFIT